MDEKGTDLHCGLKRLTAYRQGTLPPAERERVQEHLSLCPRCTGLLRELRDFETAAARGDAGPESLRQEAWGSLVQRLPVKTPAIRPVTDAVPRETRRHLSRFAVAALLLAVLGLTLWAAVTALQERQRLTRLERQLEERDAALAAVQRSLAETERQLAAAHGRIQDLEKQRNDQHSGPEEKRDQIAAASPGIEVSVAPRYVLRGQETSDNGFLRGGGAVNPLRASPRQRFAAALNLGDRPACDEYRIELVNREGKVLWAGRRPAASLLGDAGTSVSISGLGPGRYRLKVSGLCSGRSEPVAEYLLEAHE